MKGKILDYSIQESKGLITGDDGSRYSFQNSEWKADKVPSINQRVDFEIDGKNAVGIYIDASSSFDTEMIKSSLSDIQNSELFISTQDNVNRILKAGVQNKLGSIISISMAIALFFPIISITFGSISLLNFFWGKVAFLLLVILCVLFYSGAKRTFVKIAVGIVLAIVTLLVLDLLFRFGQYIGDRGYSLSVGLLFVIPLSIALFRLGFKSEYKENI